MNRFRNVASIAAIIISVFALYVVLSTPTKAADQSGVKPLKIAVVDYQHLFNMAKVKKDREAKAKEEISGIYEKPAKKAEADYKAKAAELRELRGKKEANTAVAISELESELKVLEDKIKFFKREIKASQAALMTKFRAQAMAGILIEVRGHAERNGYDLVFNYTDLKRAEKKEGEESDSIDDLRFDQSFSAELSNSALLFFNGKNEFAPSKDYTIVDITSAVSDTVAVKGWEEMKGKIYKFLGQDPDEEERKPE